jgi:hypothetical protein
MADSILTAVKQPHSDSIHCIKAIRQSSWQIKRVGPWWRPGLGQLKEVILYD